MTAKISFFDDVIIKNVFREIFPKVQKPFFLLFVPSKFFQLIFQGEREKREMAAEREIDHSLYSRQYYVYGKEAMEKMAKSTVLLSGLDGVGVEVRKRKKENYIF